MTGEPVYSFAMLTINTNGHAPMRNRHRPTDVKRMVAILPRGSSGDWLDTSAEQTMAFMRTGPWTGLLRARSTFHGLRVARGAMEN